MKILQFFIYDSNISKSFVTSKKYTQTFFCFLTLDTHWIVEQSKKIFQRINLIFQETNSMYDKNINGGGHNGPFWQKFLHSFFLEKMHLFRQWSIY